MKQLLLINIGITVIISGVLGYFFDTEPLFSYLSGALIVCGNLGLLFFSIKWLLRKKLIALSLSIIVFKYAFLGLIIYELFQQHWFQPLWFGVGLATLVLASGLFGIVLFKKKETESHVI